nr:PH domain-containing protein [Kineococcus vitellinus]
MLWRNDWFMATDRRLLLTYGVFRRQVAMMPLSKVTDMSYNRSLAGRLLGYGELVMESAGQDRALSHVDRLPMPDQVYVRICEQLFGEVGVVEVGRPLGRRVRQLARRALSRRRR